MSEVINLRRVRKARARAAEAAEADANRAKHGVSKSVRDLTKARAEKVDRDLASGRLDQKS